MAKATRTRGRSCTGKLRHNTPAKAEQHRARLIRRGAWHAALVVYPCPGSCGGWHVGHAEHRRRHRG